MDNSSQRSARCEQEITLDCIPGSDYDSWIDFSWYYAFWHGPKRHNKHNGYRYYVD